ncbi:MAG: stage V sporulation protein AE [Eubacteriales bacterium]|nr:stage V sporulation protein AE [Eubacteriales bacterium]
MDYVYAFLIGGIVCAIGQVLLDATKLTGPRVLVIFVVSGVILQAFNLYQPLVDFAGSGATVPLPGFGYSLAKGAIEGASNGILGAITGALTSTAAGITAAIVFGYLVAVLFNPKSLR